MTDVLYKGEMVMEKYLNLLDGTIVILLGVVTAGIINAIPGLL